MAEIVWKLSGIVRRGIVNSIVAKIGCIGKRGRILGHQLINLTFGDIFLHRQLEQGGADQLNVSSGQIKLYLPVGEESDSRNVKVIETVQILIFGRVNTKLSGASERFPIPHCRSLVEEYDWDWRGENFIHQRMADIDRLFNL